ncbi:hypothetical protein N7512_000080 [Penicillium capsulatum]|nr:hypothetical protein N7512_000080 [Penicillium capsulatum]
MTPSTVFLWPVYLACLPAATAWVFSWTTPDDDFLTNRGNGIKSCTEIDNPVGNVFDWDPKGENLCINFYNNTKCADDILGYTCSPWPWSEHAATKHVRSYDVTQNDTSSSTTSTSASTSNTASAATSSSASSSATASAAAAANQDNSSSISGGAIAGIVIGVVAAVAIAALVFFFLRRRRNQSAYSPPPAHQQTRHRDPSNPPSWTQSRNTASCTPQITDSVWLKNPETRNMSCANSPRRIPCRN